MILWRLLMHLLPLYFISYLESYRYYVVQKRVFLKLENTPTLSVYDKTTSKHRCIENKHANKAAFRQNSLHHLINYPLILRGSTFHVGIMQMRSAETNGSPENRRASELRPDPARLCLINLT